MNKRLYGLAAAALIGLATAPGAMADGETAIEVRPISAGGPASTTCSAPPFEYGPHLAVNPRNPRNLVSAWVQGHQNALVIAVSKDGGRTWREVAPPGFTACSLGEGAIAADPRLAFTSTGALLLSAERFGPTGDHIVVSRSEDGGETWSLPAVVPGSSDPATGPNGEATLATDPGDASRAYVTWSRQGLEPPGIFLSRTTDGGAHWEAARNIHTPEGDDAPYFTKFGQVKVIGEGNLLAVFLQYDSDKPQGHAELWAMRSADHGESWLPPEMIAEVDDIKARDPHTLAGSQTHTPAFDVARDGTAFVAWHDIKSTTESSIRIARSGPTGGAWKELEPVTSLATTWNGQAFLPTLAVAPDGTVGVTYYDQQNDGPDDELWTEVIFAESHRGAAPWSPIRLAGPFDMRTAPTDPTLNAPLIGMYFGLVAFDDGFGATFVQAEPQAAEPPTDVFFARIRTSGG